MNFSKNILITLALVGILIAGLWWGMPSSTSPDLLTTESTAGPEGDVAQSLLSLKAVSLSGTIFSDPAFQSLNDIGVEIVEEPKGRRNPFEPLQSSLTAPVKLNAPSAGLPAKVPPSGAREAQ